MLSRLVGAGRTRFVAVKSQIPRTFPASQNVVNFHAGARREQEEKSNALPPSFLEKTGLNDPKRFAPIALALAIPAISGEFYVLNEESQLACCFFLFVTTAYGLGGDAMAKMIDESTGAMLKEQNKAEDVEINALEEMATSYKSVAGMDQDIKEFFAAYKQLISDFNVAKVGMEAHVTREHVVRVLESMARLESDMASEEHSSLVNNATSSVRSQFESGGQALRADAMNQAIASLENPDAGSDKDVIADLYKKFINDYKTQTDQFMSKDSVQVSLSAAEKEKLLDFMKANAVGFQNVDPKSAEARVIIEQGGDQARKQIEETYRALITDSASFRPKDFA